MGEVNNIILTILRKYFGDDILPETLLKTLPSDSLTVVEVMMEIEDRFVITLSDDSFDGATTIRDIIGLIIPHLE